MAAGEKSIPKVTLTPLTLAVWFMDDGSKSHRALYLNTQQFELTNQQLLISMLKQQWDIDASLNRDKCYYRIRIAVNSVQRFKDIISPYLLSQFAYKFPT